MNYPKGLEQWIVEMLQGELDEEQRQKLESWLEEDPANRELLDKIREEKRWQGGIRQIAYFDDKMDWSAVLQTSFRRRRVIRMYRACAVAGIVLLLGVGGLFLMQKPEKTRVIIARVQPHEVKLNTASGKSYSLDLAGDIITEETVLKSDGKKLMFEAREQANGKVEWNTVDVPRGGTYNVELSDGTEVFLNAESILRFPNSFEEGTCREIWIDGEAYFKVKRDEAHPFVVHTGNIEVEVLGTEFNLMAYHQNPEEHVTLVRGKVKVRDCERRGEVVLTPGVQAVFDKDREIMTSQKVDVGYYTAWMEDLFAFRETPFDEVMRILARWYDFEFFFQNPDVQDFIYSGKVARYATLNEVLDVFRQTGDLDFDVKDKVVIVRRVSSLYRCDFYI